MRQRALKDCIKTVIGNPRQREGACDLEGNTTWNLIWRVNQSVCLVSEIQNEDGISGIASLGAMLNYGKILAQMDVGPFLPPLLDGAHSFSVFVSHRAFQLSRHPRWNNGHPT
ncbi:hypothetical protein QCA50_014491 [Cerrena zonata]|uniref:Uncharacterized protein n=1 Tax=Cerrena zonata TaxID=2478898 RepID=A0AAW0FMV2_9APHY